MCTLVRTFQGSSSVRTLVDFEEDELHLTGTLAECAEDELHLLSEPSVCCDDDFQGRMQGVICLAWPRVVSRPGAAPRRPPSTECGHTARQSLG